MRSRHRCDRWGNRGAVVAGLLAEPTGQRVLVLEAGPDYGPFGDGRWPVNFSTRERSGTPTTGTTPPEIPTPTES